MAENPSNGRAPDGPQTTHNGAPPSASPPQPLMPRIAAPEGARSARAFDGSPLPVETPAADETTAFDDALEAESSPAPNGVGADLHESLPRPQNGETNGIESAAPLGIALEKLDNDEPLNETSDTNGFEAYASADFDQSEFGDADDDIAPYDESEYGASLSADVTASEMIEGEQLFADDGAGGEPPSDNTALAAGASGRPDTPKDQEQGLFEHLNELRSRLLHAIIGVMAVMCITWSHTYQLQDWFAAPIRAVLNENGIKKGDLVLLGAPEAFTLFFQFSLTSALIISMPWVLFQVWRFVEPALTNSERRYTLVLVPFSSTLFFMGAGLGYVCAPLFFKFFLEYQPPGVLAQWKYDDSIILMAKMLLIFGLAFQVPIIIIFGHKIGLISRNLLIEYWRHAVVVIFVVVAVLTPTWDPVTMTACALPPCLLYLLSIWLVKWL